MKSLIIRFYAHDIDIERVEAKYNVKIPMSSPCLHVHKKHDIISPNNVFYPFFILQIQKRMNYFVSLQNNAD